MEVKIFDDYDALSQRTAEEVIKLVKEKPDAVVCLASGNTPLGTCEWIAKKVKAEKIDISKCNFIGLDEWVGVPKENTGSCSYFFHHNLFEPLNISAEKIFLFDALSNDLNGECKKMDNIIKEKGGIDLIIVGIGMNGHIGFNEPGVDFSLLSHVISLHETTITVGQKYFAGAIKLSKGITLGLGHLMNAQKAILIANGKAKAEVISKTVNEPVNNNFPAGIMQKHPDGFVFVDKDAASIL
ncbi:MAG: glucosamine-6-phosphate deaminase [Bacteroidetes bacterium]|nr:glucosamine-6-phosphate deaminase [Bacteroidota bacterium]